MNRARCMTVRACSWLAGYPGTWIIVLALLASLPISAQGPWTGGPTGPIYYNGGNVGIGATSPTAKLEVSDVYTSNAAAARHRARTVPLTAGNSISISRTYDAYGNLASVTDARGVLTEYSYDPEGLCLTQIATAGHVTTRHCDRNTGLLSDETQVDGNSSSYDIKRVMGYDVMGRVTSVKEASGTPDERTTTTQYDDVNRKVTVTAPLDSERDLVTVSTYL